MCDTIVSHFLIVHLSILSAPTLCLKDPQTRNDTIHPEILLTVGVIHWNKVAWVSATQKQEKLSFKDKQSFIVRCSNCIKWTRKKDRESVRVYEQRDTPPPAR